MASLKPNHPVALTPALRSRLGVLAMRAWAEDFYLAGSTALALYMGHRPVVGLDLMSPTSRLASPQRRDILEDLLALDAGVRVETARNGYLFVRLPEGKQGWPLRLFYYPYPQADPQEELQGLAVASAVDLGLMKLGAIISRGTRRDFVDLYLLCRALPLAELLPRAEDKFSHVRDFPLQALKGLADHSLVEGEPMPRLDPSVGPLEWDAVESWLHREVRALGREAVGLSP